MAELAVDEETGLMHPGALFRIIVVVLILMAIHPLGLLDFAKVK